MNAEMKERLLLRKFSSLEYMHELENYFSLALEGMVESIKWFYSNPPTEDWRSWHISDRPDGWERRAVPNFERILDSIKLGIENYKNGDYDRICGTANSIHTLSKDMDVLGDKWWTYVDKEAVKHYGDNINRAKKIASNIWWTIGEYWNEGEILDEEITGPVDEKDLLRYLQPGDPYP